MSKINSPPFGLTDLLGNKQFGQNPSDLAQTVVPTLDLYPYYAYAKEQYVRATGSVAGRGAALTLTTDPGEAWIPRIFSGQLAGASGSTSVQIELRLRDMAIANRYVVLATSPLQPVVVGDIVSVTWEPSRLFILQPDTAIQVHVNANSAAGPDFYELQCWYDKLLV